jgi:NTE family protein
MEKYAVKLPFNNFKIKLPSALSRGHNTYSLLLKLLIHVNTINDFSKLPIPFFCIATNIENGKQVILDKGNLTQSIMASGALPSLFQPVTINGDILIDGGVVNNYPIDELRAKGMDVIIGVDVQDDLASRDELTSAPEVLIQINNFRTINDMKAKVKKTDIYIKPNIKDFNVVSFNQGNKIINSGRDAAMAKLNSLREVASFAPNVNQKVKLNQIDSLIINDLKLRGWKIIRELMSWGNLKLKKMKK